MSLLGRLLDHLPQGPRPSVTNRAPVDLSSSRLGFASGALSPATAATALSVMDWSSVVFPIVERLATSQAAVTWRLYRKPRPGTPDDEREEVTSHPALQVWNHPNPFWTQDDLIECMQQHYELTGEWWLLVGRAELLEGEGPPLELWPVRPDKMRPVPDPEEYVKGYVYTGAGRQIPLRVKDVLFSKRNNPRDPYRGISPIGALLLDLDGERGASEYNAKFFANGAHPGGIIEVAEHLQDPEFNELRARWNEQHKGAENAHRVAIMDNTATWRDIAYTRRDMEFTALRDFNADSIRRAFGFPKPLLGDSENVNRANADAAEVMFARWLVSPRAEKIKRILNTVFLPMFGPAGRDVMFDFDDPVPADRAAERLQQMTDRLEEESRVRRARELIKLGFDIDEVLDYAELPRMTFVGPPDDAPEETESDDEGVGDLDEGEEPEPESDDTDTTNLFRGLFARELAGAGSGNGSPANGRRLNGHG